MCISTNYTIYTNLSYRIHLYLTVYIISARRHKISGLAVSEKGISSLLLFYTYMRGYEKGGMFMYQNSKMKKSLSILCIAFLL